MIPAYQRIISSRNKAIDKPTRIASARTNFFESRLSCLESWYSADPRAHENADEHCDHEDLVQGLHALRLRA